MADGSDERLVVMLEARISEFEKRMRKAEGTGTGSYNRLRRGSRGATAQMEADMTRASSRINQALASTSTQIGTFAKSFALGFGTGLITTAFAGLTAGVNQTINSLAQLGDEAKRAGVSVEAFQEWKYVAEQNRIGVDALVDGFKELNLRADEFIVTGGGSAREAFERLGYSAAELRSKLEDPSALMLEIIGRLEGMDKAAQIRIADELFGGTGGEQFVQLLDQGEAGIRKTIERARELGVVIDSDMVAKAQELDAKFSEVGAVIDSLWKGAIVGAAEFFGFVNERLNDLLTEGEGREILGPELYSALSQLGTLTDDQIEKIRLLKGAYAEMALQSLDAADALVTLVQQLPEGALRSELEAASLELRRLSTGFRDGSVSASELHDGVEKVRVKTNEAVTALSEADQVAFDSVIGEVGALATALDGPIGRAKELWAWLQRAAGLDPASQAGSAGLSRNPYDVSTSAPMDSSLRPQLPGVDSYGNWEEANDDKGKGKKSGGGKKENRIDSLIAALQTEEELLTEWYEKALEMLNGATEAELAALGGKHEAIERLEQEHADRLAAIDAARNGFNLQSVLGAGADILGAMGATNKKALKLSQGFAAAEALVSTMRGAAKELEKGTFGFGSAMAVIAKGMGFIAAIKGANEKGSASVGGGSSAPTASAPPQPDRSMYITVHGQSVGRESIKELFNQINEGLDDGFRLKGVEFRS